MRQQHHSPFHDGLGSASAQLEGIALQEVLESRARLDTVEGMARYGMTAKRWLGVSVSAQLLYTGQFIPTCRRF